MKKLLLLIALLFPLFMMAHPGHGETEGFTIKHYFVEPEHALFALLAIAVIIFFLGRKKEIQEAEKQNH